MAKEKIYSFKLHDWAMAQLPFEIAQAMRKNAWNVFGIYEMVKEGLSLEKRKKLEVRDED
jgi:hypothetical protein